MRSAPLLLALCGASLGWGGVICGERLRLEAGPPSARTDHPETPLARSQGEGAALPGTGWPLADHGMWTLRDSSGVKARLSLPPGARVELVLVRRHGQDALILSRTGEAVTRLVRSQGGRTWELECDGTLPPPPEGVFEVALSQDGEVSAGIDGSEVRCAQAAPAVRDLRLGTGMARVSFLEVNDEIAPGPAWGLRLLGAALGAILLGGLGLLRRSRAALVATPLLFCAPLAYGDLASWLQAARIQTSLPITWALLLPLVFASVLVAGAWVLDSARRGRRLLAAVPALALGALPLVWNPTAGAFTLLLSACLALLIWANARRLRGFNLISLACVLAAVVCAEAAIRATPTGASWGGLSARETAELDRDFVELEEKREHRDWPDKHYPVVPTPRDGRIRVVAFGGSSTGGAFVNDDLDEFYPAELELRLGGVAQVVNQGVGGWTTLHIRRYLETRVEEVDPDIAILYVGHNDLLTQVRVPYAEAFAQWQREGLASRISGLLADFRLYQGLRFGVGALMGNARAVAVPLDDARDNLEAILAVFAERGTRSLLVREAISLERGALNPYGELLAELASDRPDVRSLDAASLLEDPARSRMFVDNVHLTRGGHGVLAQALVDELRASGWLNE